MPPKESLTNFPDVPIYQRNIFLDIPQESPSEERRKLREHLATYGTNGHILIEVRSGLQFDKEWQRGSMPGDPKQIAVSALFRNEVIGVKRIGKNSLFQDRRQKRATEKMAKLVLERRQQI